MAWRLAQKGDQRTSANFAGYVMGNPDVTVSNKTYAPGMPFVMFDQRTPNLTLGTCR